MNISISSLHLMCVIHVLAVSGSDNMDMDKNNDIIIRGHPVVKEFHFHHQLGIKICVPLESHNTCFKVYHVFNCSNNFEINRNDYRWRWHDSHRFNACKGQQKLPASDTFNISYFGPIANYQTHQRYQCRDDALYGNGVHSDHLPVCIKISVS